MRDPGRLRDEVRSGLAVALLDAGMSYRSSAGARAKTMAAVGLASSTAFSAGVVTTASQSWLAKISGAKLWVGLTAVGVLATTPAIYLVTRNHRTADFDGQRAIAARISPPAATANEIRAAGPELSAPATPAANDPTRLVDGDPRPARSEGRVLGPNITLGAELVALDAARSRLTSGDPRGALMLLEGYDRTYPRGRLRLEAEVLRIDALAKSGQADTAKRRAEAFIRRHPDSVLAPRVRAYVAQ